MSNNIVDLAGFFALALQRPAQPDVLLGWLFTGCVASAGERHTIAITGAPLRALLNLLNSNVNQYIVDDTPKTPPDLTRACIVRGKLLSQAGQSLVVVKSIHLVDVQNPLSPGKFTNNRVTLQGKLKVTKVTPQQDSAAWTEAILMTDEGTAGGHHPLIFVEPLAQQVPALSGVRDATITGRLVSQEQHNFVLVDFLSL